MLSLERCFQLASVGAVLFGSNRLVFGKELLIEDSPTIPASTELSPLVLLWLVHSGVMLKVYTRWQQKGISSIKTLPTL